MDNFFSVGADLRVRPNYVPHTDRHMGLSYEIISVYICVYLWLISYSNPPRPPRLRGEISSVFQVQNLHVAWLYL